MNTGNKPDKARSRRSKFLLWGIILIAIILLAGYMTIGGVAANRLTLPERKVIPQNNPGKLGISFVDVSFLARDGKTEIAGWYMRASTAEKAIILVHGRDASRSDAIQGHWVELGAGLNRAGFTVLMIDLRGHGESSTGRFTYGLRERQDVLGALDYLEERGYQPGKIGILGLSLGAASGIGAAADDPDIGALVTDSSFSDLRPVAYSLWESESGLPMIFLHSARFMGRMLYGIDIFDARPVDEIGKIAPRPVLLIHCQTDSILPVENQAQLAAAAPWAETWTLPECEHTEAYLVDQLAYEARVASFFNEALK